MKPIFPVLVLGTALGAAMPVQAQQLPPKPSGADPFGPGRYNLSDIPAAALRPSPGLAAPEVSPVRTGVYVRSYDGQGFNVGPRGLGAGTTLPPETLGLGLDFATETGEAGAYVGYSWRNVTFGSTVRQGLGAYGPTRTRLDLGASYGFSINERHLLNLSGGVTLGLAGYGAVAALGPGDLVAPIRRLSEPGAGFRLSWIYSLDQRMFFDTSLGYDRSYGDASTEGLAGSGRGGMSFGTTFGYRF